MNKYHNLVNLLAKSEDYEIFGNIDIEINGIAYDSRKVTDGCCFVAIEGEKFDGHNFIPRAIESGAISITCQKLPDDYLELSKKITFILTKDSRKCLAEISNAYFDFPSEKMKMIAVTGTNGKTTCTFLLKSIIELANFKCGIIGTTGIFIGDEEIPATHTTPESLELFEILSKMHKSGVEFVAMEVSSHSLIQQRVHGIKYDAAIFTNLTHDHLDYHKTIENYASAKKILFSGLESDTFAIINSDSEWSDFITDNINCKNIVKVGSNNIQNNFKIKDEKVDLDGISYSLENVNLNLKIKSNLTGKFNIENSSLVAVTCLCLNISRAIIKKGLARTNGAPGRMQRVRLRNGAIALIDYAHTPDALEKALQTCKNIIIERGLSESRLICVFGCGGDRDKTKRPEMGKISGTYADITLITSDNPRTENPTEIIQQIYSGIPDDSKFAVFEERRIAIIYAAEISKDNDIILIAGKGHEKYQIIGTTKHHFDDLEEISKYC
jgi:UDP-N-acetylmuramoyl-L-alanyl-D-glutamate--2,6-diaminopimelate ligase